MKTRFLWMILKISLPSGRHRERRKLNHFDKFLYFLPQRVAIEKRQKLRVELYFYVPQWVEHETSVFMRFSRKYFVFGSKLAYLISCWKNEAPNWRRFSSVASKLMPLSGVGFLPWHQNWCHFDYLLTYSQWAKPFIKVFLKNIQKFCCCAGIRLLPLHLLHVWKPFCDPLTYSQWERHFLSSFQKNSAHLTHIWKPFCQPIRRGFLLQFLTATFATEKRHDFWKNFPSTLYRNFRSRKTTYFPKLFQKMFSPLYRTFSGKKRTHFFKKASCSYTASFFGRI